MTGDHAHRWSVIVPFKGTPGGKSRLSQYFGIPARRALALAFLQDTVRAVQAVPAVARILVVSNDPGLGSALAGFAGPATEVLADPGGGLNAAVSHGIHQARDIDPEAFMAALTGDLAALQPADLSLALDAAVAQADRGRPLAVVADRDGTGTTMITAAPGVGVVPHFGIDSCALHEAAGHVLISLPTSSSLRLDIDSAEDLYRATALTPGAGPATRAVLFTLTSSVDEV